MMKKKSLFKIVSCTIAVILLFSCVKFENAYAANRSVVYTKWYANGNSRGTGSKEDPYNLLKDAIDNVAEGGTIYITGDHGFINVIEHKETNPFVINKKVTIASDTSSGVKATLTVRSAGVVLGADVIFKNIKIELANSYNNAIFANGHKLTLENVERSRDVDNLVHIFAGSVYKIVTDGLYRNKTELAHEEAQPGNHAVINISGKSTLGNIYAGSINGSYVGDVDITLVGQTGSAAGAVYGAGAVTSEIPNMFEGTKPEPPTSNYLLFPVVGGKVNISLNNSKVKVLDGRNNINGDVSNVTLSNDYLSENNKYIGIDTLTINKGKFEFANLSDDSKTSYIAKSLYLKNGASLDASNWNEISLAGDLAGDGGKLVLNKDGKATFNGNFTGNIEFATHSYNERSGLVNNNHTYIQVNGTNAGTVNFKPYDSDSQSKIKLINSGNAWKTTIDSIGVAKKNTVTEIEILGLNSNFVDYNSNLTVSLDTIYTNDDGQEVSISDANIECYINGVKKNITKDTVIEVTKENGFKVGDNDITAIFAGDSAFESSTKTRKFTVKGLTPIINYSEKIVDNNYVVDVELVGTTGIAVSGNVQFVIGNTVDFENELVNGKTTFTISDIKVGDKIELTYKPNRDSAYIQMEKTYNSTLNTIEPAPNPGSGGEIPAPNPGSGGEAPAPNPGSGGENPAPNPGGGGETTAPNPGGSGTGSKPEPSPKLDEGKNDENEKIENEDGSVTEIRIDEVTGNQIETTITKDGTTIIKTVSEDNKTQIEVKCSNDNENPARIEIASEEKSVNTVLVKLNSDGTREVIKKAILRDGKIITEVLQDCKLEIDTREVKFNDIDKTYWAKSSIEFAVSRELFKGVENDKFAPQNTMTRAMLVTVLARLENVETEGGSTWYEKSVNWAKERQLSDGTNPNGNITREQLVTILYRYMDSPEAGANIDAYKDNLQINTYAKDAFRWAIEAGIIKGNTNGMLNPKGSATRAEVATVLQRLLEYYFK